MTDDRHDRPRSRLGDAARGFTGVVAALEASAASSALDAQELEQRLIEFGFVEGAAIEILHEGAIGRDPIAVRINNVTVALRRREAMAVVVE
ncbi:FeoA domain-containing protein [Bradyrhizobium sp. U87765 SZCCT0131]|uniref:FeoA family protein n=1 Tax=unclassified Bradyrhizobium TaxID=2631580 RepID=UPI001BA9161E|nr:MULTISPECIES: FeoA domain-containing protein [unclassified Bradyrhizobium]MBR1219315.1 FeoA domain-containing protein [Bradyrhizobium sp. U87765 SZCCT0131]MBR1261966.1 FeoA domain-containing protein [Bradyrhizobium sp. U87765 SZCCT0134]MBR1306181.1 FeoA domain-containing protein [Bradyrhizobium sp. U87765 SZCCT0110]MBR1317748.1 FeoA domain-containing protein [Bradyrhizobium sp. U87765 SZCCT0109]MBR1351450.1 FeoA domain-containing protein [Bradyrhizobium sp. U87765 SZCCT0048]